MRPSFLGAFGWLSLVAALYASAFGWLSPRKLRDRWRGPDALRGELTPSLACDLVTDFVLETESVSDVDCGGAVEVSGDVARLVDTRVRFHRRDWCLARVPQWRVLRATRGVPCFPTPPDAARPLEAERERVLAWAELELKERLDRIRTAMASDIRPRKCPIGEQGRGGEVPLLEFELLQGPGSVRWSFLSTSWLREAVIGPKPATALVAMERWGELRPWVAVVTSSTREEAQLTSGRARGWSRGRMKGTLTLVDAERGTLRCEAPLSFESSASLMVLPSALPQFGNDSRLSPLMGTPLTEDRVRSDFEARYRSAAATVLNEMTSWDAWPVSQ